MVGAAPPHINPPSRSIPACCIQTIQSVHVKKALPSPYGPDSNSKHHFSVSHTTPSLPRQPHLIALETAEARNQCPNIIRLFLLALQLAIEQAKSHCETFLSLECLSHVSRVHCCSRSQLLTCAECLPAGTEHLSASLSCTGSEVRLCCCKMKPT